MSSSLMVPEKFTVSESQKWLQTNLGKLTDLDDEGFIQMIRDFSKAIPRKPSKPTPIEDRIDAPYNESKCDARVWLKPGNFAGQCRCKKKDGQLLCGPHQKSADKNDGKLRNGHYNEDRPTHAFNDPEGELLEWHDVVIDKPDKKTKGSKGSGKRKRNCGNCGKSGHDKRSCPNASKDTSDKNMSVAELTALLAEAKIAEEKEAQSATETQSVDDDKTQACSNDGGDVGNLDDFEEEDHDEDLDEDTPLSPESQKAAGVGLESEEEEEKEEEKEEEEESSTIDCTFEEVPYSRNLQNEVFTDDFDVIGKWVDDKIVFDDVMTHKELIAKAGGELEECDFEGVTYSRNCNGVVFDEDYDDVGMWEDEKVVFDKFGAKNHKKAVAMLQDL
jgi:hypothetical protein